MPSLTRTFAALATATLALAACSGDDSDDGAAPTSAAPVSCAVEDLPLVEAGRLTVATGEPAVYPWVAGDDPASGEGFEAALVYALAAEMGFEEPDVTWVRSGFDEAIAPGDKEYDFNVQQYLITEERDEVVDFSDGYYQVQQALVAQDGHQITGATSVADLKTARLGAAIGTSSIDYIDEVIDPETDAAVYDDNAAAKAALDAEQVDGLVFDLPTAYYVTAVEIPDASIVGILPLAEGDAPEELGLLFAEGNPLVSCVNIALGALRENGTLADLQETWLAEGGSIPTLER